MQTLQDRKSWSKEGASDALACLLGWLLAKLPIRTRNTLRTALLQLPSPPQSVSFFAILSCFPSDSMMITTRRERPLVKALARPEEVRGAKTHCGRQDDRRRGGCGACHLLVHADFHSCGCRLQSAPLQCLDPKRVKKYRNEGSRWLSIHNSDKLED